MGLFRDSATLTVAKVSSTIIGFVGLSFFSQRLGAAGIGVFFLYQAVVELLIIPTDFGISGGIEKRMSEGEAQDEYLSAGLILKSAFLITSIFCVLILRARIEEYIGAEVAFWVIIGLLARQSANLTINILNGEHQVKKTGILHFGRQSFYVVIGTCILFWDPKPYLLIISWCAGLLLTTIIGIYRIDTNLVLPSYSAFQSLLNYASYNFISSSAAGFVYNWVDVALIGVFLTQGAVGTYEVAWRVSMITMVISNSIGTAIFPKISRLSQLGNHQEIRDVLSSVTLPSVLIVFPILFGSIVAGDLLLTVVFGEEFGAASVVLTLLLLEKAFRALHVLYGHSLKAIDRPDVTAKIATIGVIMNIFLNLALIPIFGIIGAAAATATSGIVATIIAMYLLHEYITISFPLQTVLWSLISSAAMAIIVTVVDSIVSTTPIRQLALLLLIGAISYSICMIFHSEVRKEIYGAYSEIRLITT